MAVVLEIDSLTKDYGAIRAVDNLSLQIQEGEIYGILGPNGSGKTTTLGMLLGVTTPTSGSFKWFGQESSAEIRRKIGAILESPNLYTYMDAVQNLELIAHIKKIKNPAIPELLELVNLHQRSHDAFRTYSLGMKQRLAIAGALVGNPDVVILDEPTNGLDPQGIAEVREIIRKIAEQGRTILLASHIIDEVEKVCSHVAILKKGKLIASGRVSDILSDDPSIELAAENMTELHTVLKSTSFVSQITAEKGGILLAKIEKGHSPAELNAYLFQKGISLQHLHMRKKSLEAEFLERTK